MTKRVLFFVAVLLALGATNAVANSLPNVASATTHVLLIAPDAIVAQALDRFPNTPAGKAACMAALASGNFKYYVPSFLTDRRKPRAGETVRPLEADACVGLKIAGGRKMAVPQKKGTPYIFGAKGECAVREDCGNDCDWVEYYVPTPVAVETPRQPAPTTSAVRIEIPRDPEPVVEEPRREAPRTVPVEPPPAPQRFEVEDKGTRGVTLGVELKFGKTQSEYLESLPKSGDVPQRNTFKHVVPFIRYEHGAGSGPFAYASMSALGSVSGIEFQNALGEWHDKNRTSDDSKDEALNIRGGWKFGWNGLRVGPFVGFRRDCMTCEEYVAQGANTTTKRIFQGMVLGVEASGNVGDRVTINALFEHGPSLTRKSWTKQTFGSIDFPRVNHPDEKGKSYNFRVDGEIKIAGPLHAMAGYEYLRINSHRPENYAAREYTNVNAFSIGVVAKFGW